MKYRKKKLLIDTNVLIDYLKGSPDAVAYLEKLTSILIVSSINVVELYAGIKTKKEENSIENLLQVFEIIAVDHSVAKLAGKYRCTYGKSHHIGIADALVAATAEYCKAGLVTLNTKHFPMFNIQPPY